MQTPCACAGLTALRGSDHIYAELSEIAHCCQFGRRYSEGDKNSFLVFIPLFDSGKPACSLLDGAGAQLADERGAAGKRQHSPEQAADGRAVQAAHQSGAQQRTRHGTQD